MLTLSLYLSSMLRPFSSAGASGNKLQLGQKWIESAVELDLAERWAEAVDAYDKGSQLIAEALPSVGNSKLCHALQERLASYCERQGVLERKLGSSARCKTKAHGSSAASAAAAASKGQNGSALRPDNGSETSSNNCNKDDDDASSLTVLLDNGNAAPRVEWSDIAGLHVAKQRLREAVVEPLAHPEWFTGDSRPPRAILLYGPGGTGKTHLAHAVATATRASFFAVSSADLLSKYQGESERAIKQLFDRARSASPSVVFIDEIDSIARRRGEAGATESTDRVKTELMIQMSAHNNAGVLVLGATNLPWSLDAAVVRRFEVRVYIALPDAEARRHMLDAALSRNPHCLSEQQRDSIVELSAGYSGSDMANLLRQGLTQRLRAAQSAQYFRLNSQGKWSVCRADDPEAQAKNWRDFKPGETEPEPLTHDMLLQALRIVRASTHADDHAAFDTWTREFGEAG